MENLLDFEGKEKGFKRVSPARATLKPHIGKRICYVDFIEPYRGTYFVRHGRIFDVKGKNLYIDDEYHTVYIPSIKDCGVEI